MTALKRTGRRFIAAAAILAGTGAISGAAGYALHPSGPRACSSPSLPSGDSISVDSQGNASSPATGGLEFTCAGGTWVRITGYGNVAQGVTAAYAQPSQAAPAGGWFAPDDATCAAFRAYLRHRTAKRFRVMLEDSRSALHYLRIAVAWWAKDREHHASRMELATDRAFVLGDCTDPAAQEDS
jgi:hypothetical protein